MDKYKARKFADNYLGKEEEIKMFKTDPRFRYYAWLRNFHGLPQPTNTHKCPFYQFMFWGSLLLLLLLIPFLIAKVVEYVIIKPITKLSKNIEEFYLEIIKDKPMLTTLISWIILLVSFGIYEIILLWIGSDINPIFYFGYAMHYVFIVPWLIVLGIYYVIKYILIALGWLILTIADFFVNIVPWDFVLYSLLILAAFAIASVIMYYVVIFLSKTKLFEKFINYSCEIREKKSIKNKLRDKKRKEELERIKEEKIKWEREHYEEIRKKQERNEMIRNTFVNIINNILTFIEVAYKKTLRPVFTGIKNVFVVIFSIIGETISNHCPPIDFLEEVSGTNKLLTITYDYGKKRLYISKHNKDKLDVYVFYNEYKEYNDYDKYIELIDKKVKYDFVVKTATKTESRYLFGYAYDDCNVYIIEEVNNLEEVKE